MNLSLISLLVAVVLGILLPLSLLVYWKRKTKVKLKTFLIGAVCFILFANVLESFAHQYFLLGGNDLSNAINSSPILYTLYACLAAGIFEETGRLFGFKYFLKDSNDSNDAIAYGIGHGGIEVILVLVLNYSIYALALLGVNFGEMTSQLVTLASSISPFTICLALIERCGALMLHIGLSTLVYVGVKKEGKFHYYPVAILLHALSDVPAALYQFGVLRSLIVIELLILVISITCLKVSYNIFKKEFN